MKIVFLTMQLGPSYRHGTEHYVETLGGALRDRGHAVSYLAGDPRGDGHRIEVGTPIDPERGLFAYPTRGWMAVNGLAPERVQAWLERERPDLVHVANPAHVGVGITIACRRLGIPVVVTTMDFWWICPRATLLRAGETICDGTPGWRECVACVSADHPRAALRGLARLPARLGALGLSLYAAKSLTRRADLTDVAEWPGRRRLLIEALDSSAHVIFPSLATRDAISTHLSHDRWRVIPYGLEPRWFENPVTPGSPEAASRGMHASGTGLPELAHTPAPAGCGGEDGEEKGLERTRDVIGFAGSLQPHKGADLLVTALRQLRSPFVKLRIAGTTDDERYWRELQRGAASLDVDFLGALDSREMRAFLRSLDVLVVPSRWPENLPYVLLEAQAAGIPVIASNVRGIADRIPDPELLFEPGSATDLARALGRFREISERSPAAPRVSTLDEMTTATENVYREALTSTRSRSTCADAH